MLSLEDKILLVKLYYKKQENVQQTIRSFGTARNIKSTRELPTWTGVKKLINKFEETGSVLNIKKSGRKSDPTVRDAVIEAAGDLLPLSSTRKVANEAGTSQSTAWKIIRKELRKQPFKLRVCQVLTDEAKTPHADVDKSAPIADLFPETTIMFADISG